MSDSIREKLEGIISMWALANEEATRTEAERDQLKEQLAETEKENGELIAELIAENQRLQSELGESKELLKEICSRLDVIGPLTAAAVVGGIRSLEDKLDAANDCIKKIFDVADSHIRPF